MKKRFIAAFLIMGMLISVLPVAAETKSFDNLIFGEDYSRKIVVTDFTFNPSSALVAGGTVTASCNVKTADGVSATQSCTLIVMVYNGGKLFDLKTGTVTANGTAQPLTLSVPANLPSDITNVKVYAYIWTDFLSLRNGFLQPRILARPATFGSSSNSLYELNINGTPIDIDAAFASGDTYNYPVFEKIPQALPVITAKADDLGAKVEIENIDSMGETATVKVTAQTGAEKEYKIKFDTKAKDKVTVADAVCGDANSNPKPYAWTTWYPPTTGIYMQTRISNGASVNNDSNSLLTRAVIQLDVTKFPDANKIKDVILTLTGQFYIEDINRIKNPPAEVTFQCYDFNEFAWDEATAGQAAAEDSTITVGPLISDIIAKTPFYSYSYAPQTDAITGPWLTTEISVKDLVINAKKSGKTKATLVIFADNSSRANLTSDELVGYDDFAFRFGTRENTTATRKPKVELIEYISE